MSALPIPQAIPEYTALDRHAISKILADQRPAIFRGLVGGWPAVERARESPAALVRYLNGFDSGKAVDALLMEPGRGGRIFYDETLSAFNFVRNRLPLSAVAAQVLRYSRFPDSPAVAAQSALIRDCLPGFSDENGLDLVADDVLPRIWLGNRITTPAHVDEWDNIGCVVAGRRRFTLFPPDQIANLYIGPLDFAPTGAPMSLVQMHDPDLDRFPNFAAAMAAAHAAEVAPGDAIFIPALWWHHVESLEAFNVLVNYWSHAVAGDAALADSAFDALLHGILSIRCLPRETRRAWAAFFEQYVFGDQAATAAHIPEQRRGILDTLSAEQIAGLRAHLAKKLVR